MKIAYHFTPNDRVYSGKAEVYLLTGYDDYILPQLATWQGLPNHDEQTEQCRFNEEGIWEVVKKFVVVTAYNKQTQQPKGFEDESLVDDEHTLLIPLPYSIWVTDKWVQQTELVYIAKREEINRWRDIEEQSELNDVIVDGIKWDADPAARSRVESTLASDFIPPFWTDAEDNDQPIDKNKLQAIHNAIVERGFDIHARMREMKQEITVLKDADDFAALEAYVPSWAIQ
ncbi:DUF4376 domain-containing protein [Vibrio lamellibrachiae]|uniref:DUF4376 domain-containing protein n=1 Tax=Vibrio lamellibrachiae TaxID=2910253 RepID=UPI003D123D4B